MTSTPQYYQYYKVKKENLLNINMLTLQGRPGELIKSNQIEISWRYKVEKGNLLEVIKYKYVDTTR